MQIGMMGLGRMGANMVRRLMRDGHECVVYDINPASVAALVTDGALGAASLTEFVGKLAKPRCVWLMLPAAITGKIADQVAALMEPGDIIIDGGNSYYRDAVDQAAELAPKGLHYVDVGTSGGVWGLERGYCLMIGGPDTAVKHLDPIFATLAPGADAGRKGGEDRVELLDHRRFAADHQAVAAIQPPDAAAGADVDIVQAVRLQLGRAPQIIVIVGIATIDHNIARRQQRREIRQRRIDHAGRHHQPDRTRRMQLRNQIGQ